MRYATCVIDISFDGEPLLRPIREQLGISRKSLRHTKYVKDAILVDGQPARTDDAAHAGSLLSVAISDEDIAATPSSGEPEQGPLDVLYQDEDLLVVNKPAGLVVHPRVGHTSGTLLNFAAGHLATQGLTCGCHPVHRLDQGTSGAIVFALNGYAQAQLQRQLHKSFHREYLAICEGWFENIESKNEKRQLDVLLDGRNEEGQLDVLLDGQSEEHESNHGKDGLALSGGDKEWRTIDAAIGRRSDIASTTFAVIGDAPCVEGSAKEAVTHFKVVRGLMLASGERLSLVRLKLETGRTHQIRVHMAHIGHPLLGDTLYGKACERENESGCGHARINRPALHSWCLSFLHPLNGRKIEVEAPLPQDFLDLIGSDEFASNEQD